MITKDNPDLKCPGCGRAVRRKGSFKTSEDDPRPAAVLADGTCTPCWNERKGRTATDVYRAKEKYKRNEGKYRRPPMTAEEIERERERIKNMECDRLSRGVPPEGLDPKDWAYGNGGAYSWEV